MSPQALRFAQGRILGETNSSWYVGDITPENEIRVMECISKLDTHEIKSPYREDIRPDRDGEEYVRSVKISHRREPDGKYAELIRIIQRPTVTAIGSTLHRLEVGAYTMCFILELRLLSGSSRYLQSTVPFRTGAQGM